MRSAIAMAKWLFLGQVVVLCLVSPVPAQEVVQGGPRVEGTVAIRLTVCLPAGSGMRAKVLWRPGSTADAVLVVTHRDTTPARLGALIAAFKAQQRGRAVGRPLAEDVAVEPDVYLDTVRGARVEMAARLLRLLLAAPQAVVPGVGPAQSVIIVLPGPALEAMLRGSS